ncbi:MAG: F0F1 ATP synthase subunit A [Phycisphaeraceae bacterium]|nr:MAG: F0F1 ATP synthase subunit A [Phycisphaeraceae bacterium]
MIDIPLATLFTLAADSPVDHVVNHPFLKSDSGVWLWSAHVGTLVLAGLILLILGPMIARQIGTGPESEGNDRYITKGRLAQTVEVICLYLREKAVRPLLHDRTDRFMPFLWTIFFFILVNNLLGLIPILDVIHLINSDWKAEHRAPIGGTATSNIAVTAVLAFISFLVINAAGIKELGVGGYLKHLTGGAPAFIWPILVPVEILGTFIKPVALAIRLFANMTAGHVLLATLFMFVGMSLKTGLAVGAPVTLISCIGAVAIMFLELFVAFLQAFVFMFLTTVFISQLSHHGDHDHAHDHAHDHSHGGHPHPAH